MHDDQVLLGLLLLRAQGHSLDGRLSPQAALVVGHMAGLVDQLVQPVAEAKTREALDAAVDLAMAPLFDGVFAIAFVVLADVRRSPEEFGRELVQGLDLNKLVPPEERLGTQAYGNTMQALHTLRTALASGLKGSLPAPTPELLRPYLRLLVALVALHAPTLASPGLVALFARQQASDFAARVKQAASPAARPEPSRLAVDDPSDVAFARAAMRAWFARSADERPTPAR